MTASEKQRFIIAGLGNRGRDSFARSLLGFEYRGLPEFKEKAEIVAFVDTNRGRARVANDFLGTQVPIYSTVDEAADAHEADWTIVTTPDHTHADVACAALNRGMDVVIDKPFATSVWECNRIIKAGEDNSRQVIVGHNYRYNEYMLTLAKMVRSGEIGNVLQVEAAEILDLDHGGSYFHRWHAEFKNSAGLMNHKCCHQVDIVNWVLNDDPVGVAAMGDRTYYVPRPDLNHGDRCLDCPITATCPHYCDVDAHDHRLRRMYVDVEKEDGYIRDRCVFSDRNTVNDREVLNIRYSKGTTASFSLCAFAPREYSYFLFTGTRGRLEYTVNFDSDRTEDTRGKAETGAVFQEGNPSVRLFRPDGKAEDIPVNKLHEGFGHGGADVKLIGSILGVEVPGAEPIARATPQQARNAVAVADMAARSIADSGAVVNIDATGKDFPPAPPSGK